MFGGCTVGQAASAEGSFESLVTFAREVEEKGFTNWATQQTFGRMRESVTGGAGKWGEMADRVAKAGEHQFSILDDASTTLTRLFDAQSFEEADQLIDDFQSRLTDRTRQMFVDAIPDPIRSAVETAQDWKDNVNYVAGKTSELGEVASQSVTKVRDAIENINQDVQQLGTDLAAIDNSSIEDVVYLAESEQSWVLESAEGLEGHVSDHVSGEFVEYSLDRLDIGQSAVYYSDPSDDPYFDDRREIYAEHYQEFGWQSEEEAFNDDSYESSQDEAGIVASATLSKSPDNFAEDISFLEQELGVQKSTEYSNFDNDLEWLTNKLGNDETRRDQENPDWVQEAAEAEMAATRWKVEQTQKERARQEALIASERQHDIEQQRRSIAQAAASGGAGSPSYPERSSTNSDSRSSGESLLGAVVTGAAQGYLAGKYGVVIPTPHGHHRNTNTQSNVMDATCAEVSNRITPTLEACLNRAIGLASICDTARIIERCALDAAASSESCPSLVRQLREQAASAAETARGFCAN